MFFFLIFGINEEVIEVYYHKNVKFLFQSLIYIALKYGQCVSQLKKHYLILKKAIAGFNCHLLFISFFNLYLIIDINQVKLSETLSLT